MTSIKFKVIGSRFEPIRLGFLDLSKWETLYSFGHSDWSIQVVQHYKAAISAHHHNLVPKTPTKCSQLCSQFENPNKVYSVVSYGTKLRMFWL